MRALLVVADQSTREHLRDVLNRRGWDVSELERAELLIDACRDVPSRLVIVEDSQDGSGADACRALRREAASMFTYILGVTLQHDTVAVRRMMEAGVDDVLAAPCGEPEMEMRLAVAEGRIGPPIGFQEAAELADRVGEIQRNYKVQRAFLEGLLESAPEESSFSTNRIAW